ncbi:MAG: hypothetical protein K6T75_00645 [Acetobacteraceae bacterium]|nr:hypothetical protein [Acetobacteraceae bacterium]
MGSKRFLAALSALGLLLTLALPALSAAGGLDPPTIAGGRFCLPAAVPLRAVCRSFGARWEATISDPATIAELTSLLQGAPVMEDCHRRLTGVALDLLYEGERSITAATTLEEGVVVVHALGKGWVDFGGAYLRAPALASRLHALAAWRPFDPGDIRGLRRIAVDTRTGSFVVDDPAVLRLVEAGLREATYCGPAGCPFGRARLRLILEDRTITGFLTEDDCATVVLEANEFEADENAISVVRLLLGLRGRARGPTP